MFGSEGKLDMFGWNYKWECCSYTGESEELVKFLNDLIS